MTCAEDLGSNPHNLGTLNFHLDSHPEADRLIGSRLLIFGYEDFGCVLVLDSLGSLRN